MRAPRTILLLHGMHGSGRGSVSLLEAELRAQGWDHARYLRPTLPGVNTPGDGPQDEVFFRACLAQAQAACPPEVDLVVGLSYGGLLAAFLDSPQRRSVCSPWGRLPSEALQGLVSRPGWVVLHGAKDTVVPLEVLECLPAAIPRQVDAEGTHDFDAWMRRIASWVIAAAT